MLLARVDALADGRSAVPGLEGDLLDQRVREAVHEHQACSRPHDAGVEPPPSTPLSGAALGGDPAPPLGAPLPPCSPGVLVEWDEDPLAATLRRGNPRRGPVRERRDRHATTFGSRSDAFGAFDAGEPAERGHLPDS